MGKDIMKHSVITKLLFAGIAAITFQACVSQGTLTDRSEILQKPFRNWTIEECTIIMKGCASTNYFRRDAPLQIIVIPLTPNFLLAYNWQKWKQHQTSIDVFCENTDRQARNCFGGIFDKSGTFFNASGQSISDFSNIDSLLLIIHMENINCLKAVSSSGMDAIPDITNMETKLSLRDGRKIIASPKYVKGSDAKYLMNEEELIVMFHIDNNLKQYFQEHKLIDLHFDLGYLSVDVPMKFSL